MWWREAVGYEVYVRSFADGNGDGVGDLAGARDRLPYLAELGVDCLWLTPFYRSPQADHGYDVADHLAVDPLFGTDDDAAALISDAHRLGLRLLVDVIPNHTSDQHPWFAAHPERYHVVDRVPNAWQSIFGGPAWSRLPDGRWYLHLFAPEQPDLNWEHPEVRAYFERVLRYWLDRGVDGIRIDALGAITKAPGYPEIRPGRRTRTRTAPRRTRSTGRGAGSWTSTARWRWARRTARRSR